VEKEFVEFVVIGDPVRLEKSGIGAGFPADELAFEEFEEKNAVEPGDAEFECDAEALLFGRGSELIFIGGIFPGAADFEFGEGILEQGAVVAGFAGAGDASGAPFFDFLESEDIEKLFVETAVEGIESLAKGFLSRCWGERIL
jgi:hypothetical protein